MAIYDNDGTVNREVGKVYDNNGSVSGEIDKVYDNDGTTNSLIYQSWDGKLFTNGDIHAEKTGGWYVYAINAGVIANISTRINLSMMAIEAGPGQANYHTGNPIDLSSYDYISFEYEINWGSSGPYANVYFMVCENPYATLSTSGGVVRSAGLGYGGIIKIDISALKGSYYIIIGGRCSGYTVYTYTSRVWVS